MNQTQELMFSLMRRSSFNNFNGDAVCNDLIQNEKLWSGVFFTRQNYLPLLPLRDIGDDFINADEVYIAATTHNSEELHLLALTWGADDVEWLDPKVADKKLGTHQAPKILRCWWD